MRTVIATFILLVASAMLPPAMRGDVICGDANGDGNVTVTDGVVVLRRAADLPGACDVRACDTDANGTISVTDGVNVLRLAAELGANANCPNPDVTNVVDGVSSTDGGEGTLDVGVAPVPTNGAPSTVSNVSGSSDAPPGGDTTLTVSFDTQGQGSAAEIAAASSGATLIIAVLTSAGAPRDGFFELPLPDAAGQIGVVVHWGDELGTAPFSLAFATQVSGSVSQYRTFVEHPVVQATPRRTVTPRPTVTPTGPVCGNGVVEPPGETCDPPCVATVGSGCSVNSCRADCTFCGDGVRNGNEECDANDKAQCNGVDCDLTCHCVTIF